jgi:predicted transcriptional regulator
MSRAKSAKEAADKAKKETAQLNSAAAEVTRLSKRMAGFKKSITDLTGKKKELQAKIDAAGSDEKTSAPLKK